MRALPTHELSEPLGVLLLPSKLEEFERAEHARRLLAIPRVVALEASRHRIPRLLRDAAPVRQAKRLRLPGEPRVLVLYHPRQYPLARALTARHGQVELWYARPEPSALAADPNYMRDELADLDRLAQDRACASCLVDQAEELYEFDQALRVRLRELEIISARPFVPGGRVQGLAGRRR